MGRSVFPRVRTEQEASLPPADVTQWGARGVDAAVWGLVALTWLTVLPRILPSAYGDHGTFVSVADRLRAGDRLYADVWDNKDPLFYYLLAAARSATEFGDILLEIGWLVLAAAAGFSIARRLALSPRRAILAGFAVAPIILTGTTYVPGMTHVPAAAISLWTLVCVLKRRWGCSGVLVGVMVLLKLVLVPVAAVLILVPALQQRELRGLTRGLVAAAATVAAVALVMAARGELGPYLDTQADNLAYANGQLVESQWGPTVRHLLLAIPEDGSTAGLTTLVGILVLALVSSSSRVRGRTLVESAVWWGAITTAGVAIIVLATTALWPHHLQILYIPGVLAVLCLASMSWTRAGGIRAVTVLILAAYLVGGALHPYWFQQALAGIPAATESLRGPSEQARALGELAPAGSYGRLGTNDVGAHARGTQGWKLACPRFHQYPFDPPEVFAETLACIGTPDVVIRDSTFAPQEDFTEWNAFVKRAQALLQREYRCTPKPFGELCVRAAPGAARAGPRLAG